jgi:hypothetical protein
MVEAILEGRHLDGVRCSLRQVPVKNLGGVDVIQPIGLPNQVLELLLDPLHLGSNVRETRLGLRESRPSSLGLLLETLLLGAPPHIFDLEQIMKPSIHNWCTTIQHDINVIKETESLPTRKNKTIEQ